MKIDAHVHLNIPKYKDIKKAAREVIREMDACGIDKAILLPDNQMNVNSHIDEACKLFPDRFYGFGMVDPKDKKEKILKDMDNLARKKWFKGIKIHPRTQHFTLKEPGVFHIARHIASYDLPLTIDCFPSFKFIPLNEGMFPNAFDRLAKENPTTNIIMAHMGGHRLFDAFAVARANENIFLDVAYTFYYYKGSSVESDMMFIIKKLGSWRIIYGTDYPAIGIREGYKQFGKLCDRHKMSAGEKKDIFGGTISKLIHLRGPRFKLSKKDKMEIVNLYESRLKKHGASVKTMEWFDAKQQALRFAKLSKIGKLNGKSILDVGCGFGDFYDHLRDKGVKVKYTGYDLSSGIIKIARWKHPDMHFEVKDILIDDVRKKYDYVFASGILNKKVSDNMSYARAVIAKMFELCKYGIALNMFTTKVDYADYEAHLFYYLQDEILRFARTLNRSARMSRNRPLYDYTLFINKR